MRSHYLSGNVDSVRAVLEQKLSTVGFRVIGLDDFEALAWLSRLHLLIVGHEPETRIESRKQRFCFRHRSVEREEQ